MRSVSLISLLVLLAAVGCSMSGAPGSQTKYERAVLSFPEGDPHAGREAFVSLGCASCHAVSWDLALPAPASSPEGPEFDSLYSTYSAGALATAIIAPSHSLSPEFAAANEVSESPMTDLGDTMTVRQMIDLVAFLRAHGSETYTRLRFREE